jgi:hypothetical protein
MVAFEEGMIKAWQHTRVLCNSCIKAHKEEIKKLKKMKRAQKKGGKNADDSR